jgi:ligand-binding SRPBCC domain-containing protein
MHQLVRETIINQPLHIVFDFFSKAENLNLLTPPDMNFKIITPLPIQIHQGKLIDYRIKVNGIPFKWQTEITVWQPPHKFVDTQKRGPYHTWIHQHYFEARGDNATFMRDTVDFQSPGWFLEPLIHHLFIEKKVKVIFDYREIKWKELFGN